MVPLKKAISWILISIFIISGIPWIVFVGYAYLFHIREKDSKYHIVAIAERSQGQESLKNVFLAELLHLSIDRPMNLYTFDCAEARKKLLSFACIKEASVKKIPPGIISIDYLLRKPIAFLGDFSNTAVDSEGYAFPFHPFYSPKKLPILFLGLDEVQWGKKVNSIDFAFQILENLEGPLHIDVSQGNASSLGDRKIIVRFQDHDILLDPVHFKEGLKRYHLWKTVAKEDKALTMIDLRIPKLGFIKRSNDE